MLDPWWRSYMLRSLSRYYTPMRIPSSSSFLLEISLLFFFSTTLNFQHSSRPKPCSLRELHLNKNNTTTTIEKKHIYITTTTNNNNNNNNLVKFIIIIIFLLLKIIDNNNK